MAPRTSWSGTINFGMMIIPVGTVSAVSDHDIHFNQFTAVGSELHPVGMQNYDKETGDVIERSSIQRCYVIGDTPVPILDEELAALAPEATKVISVEEFVTLSEIDPVFFAKHEYALPKKGAEKAYSLLVEALTQTGKAGVGRTVRRSKEHVVLVRAVDGALVLTFLNYADEVRSLSDLQLQTPTIVQPELDMAVMLVEAMSGEWEPTKYEDTQHARVLDMITAKHTGVDLPVAVVAPVVSKTDDMLAAMQASIDAALAKKGQATKKAPVKAVKVPVIPAVKVPAKRAPRKAPAKV